MQRILCSTILLLTAISPVFSAQETNSTGLSVFELLPSLRKQSFSSIRKLISKGQNGVAESRIRNALSGIAPETGWETFDELTALAAELRENGATVEADRCETKIFTKLVRHFSTSGDIAYIVLKRAFFRGQYQLVCNSEYPATSSGQSALSSYRFARLRARAAGASYWEYFSDRRGWPSDEEIAQFKRLAKTSTKFYEKALSKAPTSLDKIQLAAEWFRLNVTCYYEADSQALRKALLLNTRPSSELPKKQIDTQVETFRKAAQNAMVSSKQLNQLAPESKAQLADILTWEYNKIAVLGIPDDVFHNLLEDMKLFLDIGLPLKFIKNNEKRFIETLQWYLRQAVITSTPDEIEKKVIEHQIFTFGKLLHEEIAQNMSIPNLPAPPAGDFEFEWKKTYALLRNNVFAPLYKQAMLKHQFQSSINNFKESCQRISKNISKTITEFSEIQNLLGTENQTDWEKENMLKRYSKHFLIEAFFSYGKWAGPAEIDLPPDKVIFTQTATLNDYGIYTYVPGRHRPIKPFPAKKYFRYTKVGGRKRD